MLKNSLKTYERALTLVATFDKAFLDLGHLLRIAQDNDKPLFESLRKIPGLGSRKAYYLAGIDRVFGELPVERERLIQIGWTKLQLMAGVLNETNYHELLVAAENHTAQQLKAIVKGQKAPGKQRVVLFYLSPEQYRLYAKALIKHGGQKSGRGFLNHDEAVMKLIAASAS